MKFYINIMELVIIPRFSSWFPLTKTQIHDPANFVDDELLVKLEVITLGYLILCNSRFQI